MFRSFQNQMSILVRASDSLIFNLQLVRLFTVKFDQSSFYIFLFTSLMEIVLFKFKSKELYPAWRHPFQGNKHLTCPFVCIKILIYHLYLQHPTHLFLIQNVKVHTEQYNNNDCQKFLGTVKTLLWKEGRGGRTAEMSLIKKKRPKEEPVRATTDSEEHTGCTTKACARGS